MNPLLEWIIIVFLSVIFIWLAIRRFNFMKKKGIKDDDRLL